MKTKRPKKRFSKRKLNTKNASKSNSRFKCPSDWNVIISNLASSSNSFCSTSYFHCNLPLSLSLSHFIHVSLSLSFPPALSLSLKSFQMIHWVNRSHSKCLINQGRHLPSYNVFFFKNAVAGIEPTTSQLKVQRHCRLSTRPDKPHWLSDFFAQQVINLSKEFKWWNIVWNFVAKL